jgi:hypothetical protein
MFPMANIKNVSLDSIESRSVLYNPGDTLLTCGDRKFFQKLYFSGMS